MYPEKIHREEIQFYYTKIKENYNIERKFKSSHSTYNLTLICTNHMWFVADVKTFIAFVFSFSGHWTLETNSNLYLKKFHSND